MNPDNPTTTGEQIAQQIWANALSGASREVQFKAAADAINAAIAPAKEEMRASYKPQNPTTSEWTQEGTSVLIAVDENDNRYYFHCTQEWSAKQAVAAHNAALAAKDHEIEILTRENDGRDQQEAEYAAKMVAEIQARDKQLAAEREKVKSLSELADGWSQENKQLRDQLAAERDIAAGLVNKMDECGEQLAAAVEDKKRLDWLCGAGKYTDWTELDITNGLTFRDSIDAALAKIGGKK